MGLFSNSQRVWVPGLDQVQGIVIEERKSLRAGMFYTVEWRDAETLLDQSAEFAEGVLSGKQTSDGAVKTLRVELEATKAVRELEDEIAELKRKLEKRRRKSKKKKKSKSSSRKRR